MRIIAAPAAFRRFDREPLNSFVLVEIKGVAAHNFDLRPVRRGSTRRRAFTLSRARFALAGT